MTSLPVAPRANPANDRFLLPLALALLLAGGFVGLDAFEVTKNSEARVLLTASGMYDGESWLTPHMMGISRFEKPPLMYWATVLVARVRGEFSASSAAWVSAMAAAVAVLALTGGVWRLAGRRAGLFAGAMLATCGGFFNFARVAELDMLFAACCNISLVCFALWLFAPSARRWPWLMGSGVAMGFAALAKGPHALSFTVMGVAVGFVISRDFSLRRWACLVASIAIGCVPIGAWIAAAQHANPQYVQQLLGVMQTQTGETNIEPWHYFFRKAAFDTMPWILLLPAIWPSRGEREGTAAARVQRLFGVVFLSGFVLLSAIPGKQRHYILPLMAPAMGWIALALDRRLALFGRTPKWRRAWLAAGLAIAGLAGPVGSVALTALSIGQFNGMRDEATLLEQQFTHMEEGMDWITGTPGRLGPERFVHPAVLENKGTVSVATPAVAESKFGSVNPADVLVWPGPGVWFVWSAIGLWGIGWASAGAFMVVRRRWENAVACAALAFASLAASTVVADGPVENLARSPRWPMQRLYERIPQLDRFYFYSLQDWPEIYYLWIECRRAGDVASIAKMNTSKRRRLFDRSIQENPAAFLQSTFLPPPAEPGGDPRALLTTEALEALRRPAFVGIAGKYPEIRDRLLDFKRLGGARELENLGLDFEPYLTIFPFTDGDETLAIYRISPRANAAAGAP